MPLPLLETKFFAPSPRAGLVSRPRLVQKLEQGKAAGHRLALVSAPPGAGKTTLIGEWAAASGRDFAWLTLDVDDNDPVRFWTYLIVALQKAVPGVGQAALSQLQSPQPPPAQSVLIPVINDLAARPAGLVLVLDDYHLISAPEIHSGLTYLLEHIPGQVQVVLSTRADPPLPLFRLRARNHLTEIREADLRFTPNEAQVFLRDSMGLDLSREDSAALEAHAEGWIVGLQLAALAVKMSAAPGRTPSPDPLITALGAGHRYILEYLLEEVLSRQPPEVQDFLCKTSILERMCAELCDEVIENRLSWPTGQGDLPVLPDRPGRTGNSQDEDVRFSHIDSRFTGSQSILDYLSRSNLFLVPLDSARTWYRYHRLFADLLGNKLRQLLPTGEIRELHRRASRWYGQQGLIEEEVQHALAGKDFESAAALIEKVIKGMIFTGQLTTAKNWMEALPAETCQAHPRLRLYRGWVLFLQGKLSLSSQILDELENELQTMPASPEQHQLWLELITLVCRNAAIMGDSQRAIRLGSQALAFLPEDDQASRARVLSGLAIAYGLEGELDKSKWASSQSLRLAQEAGNYFLAAHTTSMIAMGMVHMGQLRAAARTYQSIIDLGPKSGQAVFHPAGEGYIGLAGIHLEWNDLAAAEEYLDRGVRLSLEGSLVVDLFAAYATRSRLFQAKGDLEAALAELNTLEQTFGSSPAPINRLQIATYQIQLRLVAGDPDGAARWSFPVLDMLRSGQRFPLPFLEVFQAAYIRLLIAQGKLEEALEELDRMQGTAGPSRRNGRLIEAHLLRALVFARQSPAIAPAELIRSLELAQPEGYLRLYLDEGESIRLLIEDLRLLIAKQAPGKDHHLLVYIGKLLSAFEKPTDTPQSETGNQQSAMPSIEYPKLKIENFVEPLSPRELEVLCLIRDGCSNQEIARRLVITLHTVKKHTSNIFSKLGVSSRTQAVARARELKLL
ncbi:MAG TPA: LuxR C-terminal-related transcriptional regulator [Anaerolineaceae bacterium]|nr:LuxR C-terminal-related transcriptional regulator [Anaerolineaceae bacterium]